MARAPSRGSRTVEVSAPMSILPMSARRTPLPSASAERMWLGETPCSLPTSRVSATRSPRSAAGLPPEEREPARSERPPRRERPER